MDYFLTIQVDNYGLGYILGDFSTNSSGHPAQRPGRKTWSIKLAAI
jgi:hypothetical protein